MYSCARLGGPYARKSKLLSAFSFLLTLLKVLYSEHYRANCWISAFSYTELPQKYLREYITYVFLIFCLNSGKQSLNLMAQYKAIHYEGKNIKTPLSSVASNSMKTRDTLAQSFWFLSSVSSSSISRDGKLSSPNLTPSAIVWMYWYTTCHSPWKMYQEEAANSYMYKIKTWGNYYFECCSCSSLEKLNPVLHMKIPYCLHPLISPRFPINC